MCGEACSNALNEGDRGSVGTGQDETRLIIDRAAVEPTQVHAPTESPTGLSGAEGNHGSRCYRDSLSNRTAHERRENGGRPVCLPLKPDVADRNSGQRSAGVDVASKSRTGPRARHHRSDDVGVVAGDDASAKQTVLDVVESVGFRPVDAGSLASARTLEGMAWLNIQRNLAGGTWQDAWVLVGPETVAAATADSRN